MSIIDKIQEDIWIKNHSLPCISEHLQENTVQTIIYPKIKNLQNAGVDDDDEFVIQISESLQTHHNVEDISKIINCIIDKMMHNFEDDDSQMSAPFLSVAAFTVLGRSILILGKKAGYIR